MVSHTLWLEDIIINFVESHYNDTTILLDCSLWQVDKHLELLTFDDFSVTVVLDWDENSGGESHD